MFNFFANSESKSGGVYKIEGADFNHIKNVLRLKEGDEILISCEGKSDLCAIADFGEGFVTAEILEEDFQSTELNTKIYLFQGLPKGDKMELIIQKAVELGVFALVPVEMARCVVKLDAKKKKSKKERWQAIAESAAKQSKRNVIPEVFEPMSYDSALKMASELDLMLVPYENERGMLGTKEELLKLKTAKSVGIFIGAEGGFDEAEIDKALKSGGKTVSLGKRILRTETAAITALSMCMLYIEINDEAK